LLPEIALERAKYLDEYLATHKKPIGPLHGLPISVKEHIGMKGLGQNGGFVSWWDRVAPEDAHIIELFLKAGCVLYVRTTQPQTLMHLECSSNLYGETVNPYNRNLTSGGSSGGEGALIGLKGSALGIGTDIGGSIRSPAANCGIWGFRPTTYRLPMGGLVPASAGLEQIVPVIGPLSTSLQGMHIFMKTLIDQKPWMDDPSLLPMPWNHPSPNNQSHLLKPNGQRKLKIGILWHDGVVKPHPPITRAMKELAAKLTSSPDIDVVSFTPYKHDLAWEILSPLYFCDNGQWEHDAIDASGEPWRPLSTFILKEQPLVKNHTINEVWGLSAQREQYRKDYARVWNETASTGEDGYPVDVVLCPVGPGAAPPLNHARYWGYTSQWNILDYPALVFPVTQVDQEKDLVEEGYEPMNEQDEWNYKLYSPEKYVDAPVSLQLVGRRYTDEKVFEAMEFIKEVVGDLPFAPLR
jgi:Asp-tRNA(Asn)/Glu-tRNA(Gln) amidotransferase A subunit family amidase